MIRDSPNRLLGEEEIIQMLNKISLYQGQEVFLKGDLVIFLGVRALGTDRRQQGQA